MATRKAGQGMRWIRLSTRLAIYHRDGWCCVYCGALGEALGVGLSLDHVVACELGGDNVPSNLVTACGPCNSAKHKLTMRDWCSRLRARSCDATRVSRRIRALVRRPINRVEGRRLERVRSARAITAA